MWIEIFRTGTFTDSNGVTQTFTADDLDLIVLLYNQRVEEDSSALAPVVKGHPETDSPAYAWVERLARRGDILYAKLKNISNELIDEVKQGKYRRVSISLYPDLMLKHVGLLGGATPAVKGLQPVEFVEFTFEKELASEVESTFGQGIAELRRELQTLAEQNRNLSHQNSLLRMQLQSTRQEVLGRSFRDFAEKIAQSTKGAILPTKLKNQLVEILEYASIADSYIDPRGEKIFPNEVQLTELVKDFVKEFKLFHLGKEFSNPQVQSNYFESSKTENKSFDEKRLELHQKVLQMIQENQSLSYEDALNKILTNKQ